MNREPSRNRRALSRIFLAAVICLVTGTHVAAADCSHGPVAIFAEGQRALQANDLPKAEERFRVVLACDPKSAAAYVNLGVVEMRRRQWTQALAHFNRAESLSPAMPGIRLDKGLVYFRQSDYKSAIPELRAAARQNPSAQPWYLLGLSYFFLGEYKPAAQALQRNWSAQSDNLVYLYVLGISAEQSGDKQTSDRAFARFLQIGGDSPEFHLLKGKAFLNRGQPADAIPELKKAIAQDPKLPFAHFNLGWAYAKKRDYPRAREEFLKDIDIEPDIPYNFEQLGAMSLFLGDYADAQKNYEQALARNPRLPSSLYGLGKIYEHNGQFTDAVKAWRAAEKLSPDSVSIHNSLGRMLQRMHKSSDAKQEFAIVTRLEEKEHADEIANPKLPSPEIKEQD